MRIETLHFLEGCHSVRNQYVVRCALTLDSVLRATDSSIRQRIVAELCSLRRVDTLDTCMSELDIPDNIKNGTTSPQILWARTKWFRNQYVELPGKSLEAW